MKKFERKALTESNGEFKRSSVRNRAPFLRQSLLASTCIFLTATTALSDTAAITMLGSMSHAQDVSFRQLGQLMTVTGGNDQAAFAFGPEWSEELGFSATGRVGFTLGEDAAVGFIGELGENVTEGMVNLGFHLPNDMSMILTAGQLRERLEFGDAGDREWVAQDEYGIAINGDNLAFNADYVDAASTENFLGAMSYGAEIEGSADISENATLAASLGYQRMEWDGDAFEALEEVTGSVDLAIDVTDTFRFNTFADYNISEAQAGIGASGARSWLSAPQPCISTTIFCGAGSVAASL